MAEPEGAIDRQELRQALQDLVAEWGQLVVAEVLGQVVDDPQHVSTRILGDEIWGVRFEFCEDDRHRRDIEICLQHFKQGDLAKGFFLEWERRQHARLVVYIRAPETTVERLWAALDGFHRGQMAKVPIGAGAPVPFDPSQKGAGYG